MATDTTTHPMTQPWNGPFGGVPPFDAVDVGSFEATITAAMDETWEEIEAIAAQSEPATFENTIVPLEQSGQSLDRVLALFYVWSSTMNNDAFAQIERSLAPQLAAFDGRTKQHQGLFARIDAVFRSAEEADLSPVQRRLVDDHRRAFVMAGCQLDDAARERVAAINTRLATLFTEVGQNVLTDEGTQTIELTSEADVAGLPASFLDGAANEDGTWTIANTRSSVDPFLTFSTRRDLRQQVFEMFIRRGEHGDTANDGHIIEMLALRAERAGLLGFADHASYRMADTMAKEPARAFELMQRVWEPAVQRAAEEVAEMQALVDAEFPPGTEGHFTIAPWDHRFYAEKVRAARYDLDQADVQPYLELENMRSGMMWVAGELFGFTFAPTEGIPTCHPDVQVWEVKRAADGSHVGLWYFDPFARPGKRSGAWMNAYRSQQRIDGEITTIVSNNSNFVKGAPGEPVTISWDDAVTLFHEFGHALHGLASDVTYPSQSGTNVPRDYVEFPSQLLEHWLPTDEVLSRFALHVETGEPMPDELREKIANASNFNQGFATVEYLSNALLDMQLHTMSEPVTDIVEFERTALEAIGMPEEIVLRHRLPHFLHIFTTDSYSAGYYSYLWSDALTADAYEAFTEAGGPYDTALGERLHREIFAVGGTIDPAEAYRRFRGRDPEPEALMRKRGFAA